MNQREHYLAAEALLEEVKFVGAKIRELNESRKASQVGKLGYPTRSELTQKMDEQGKKAMGIYAQAQVHATLASIRPWWDGNVPIKPTQSGTGFI